MTKDLLKLGFAIAVLVVGYKISNFDDRPMFWLVALVGGGAMLLYCFLTSE